MRKKRLFESLKRKREEAAKESGSDRQDRNDKRARKNAKKGATSAGADDDGAAAGGAPADATAKKGRSQRQSEARRTREAESVAKKAERRKISRASAAEARASSKHAEPSLDTLVEEGGYSTVQKGAKRRRANDESSAPKLALYRSDEAGEAPQRRRHSKSQKQEESFDKLVANYKAKFFADGAAAARPTSKWFE